MRIAVDVTSLLDAHTGVAAVLRHHLDGLRARTDAEIVAYAASWRGRDRVDAAVPAGSVDRIASRPMAARPLRALWKRTDRPTVEAWTGPIDVVWGPNFVVPPARRAARLATVHDLTCVRYPRLCTRDVLEYPGLLRRALAGGAHLHVVSRFVADEVVDLLGAPAERVHVVRNGIDPGVVAGGDPAAGRALAGAERYIVAIGTIEPRKDHPTLVRAFDGLRSVDPDLRLVLAGADGWGVEALEHALTRSRAAAAGRIIRLGFVNDTARKHLLAGAVALAYPSVYEGFGLPPLEAMATGTPVVATRAGALPEVLGEAADLVDVGDADALAGALARVVTDDAHRADLVARGHLRVGGLGWPAAQEELATLLRALAGT